MGFQRRNGTGQHIAPRAEFQWNAFLCQPLHHAVVLNGLNAMPDPVGTELVDGDQDVVGGALHTRLSRVHGDAEALGFGLLKQGGEWRCRKVHLVVGEVEADKSGLPFQHPIAPPGVLFHAFDALQKADEAHDHGELRFCPGHPPLNRFQHAVGVHVGMRIEQEGRGVPQFKDPDIAHGVHVGTGLVGQLFHFGLGVDDVPGVEEFVQDRRQVGHGFLHQKGLRKVAVVLHVHAHVHCPRLKGGPAKGQFKVAMQFDLGNREEVLVRHASKFRRNGRASNLHRRNFVPWPWRSKTRRRRTRIS